MQRNRYPLTHTNALDLLAPVRRCCWVLGGVLIIWAACTAGVLHAQEPVRASGITEPVKDVTLSLDVEGRIAKLNVKEGQTVKKNQVILSLDTTLEVLEVRRRKLVWESKAEIEAAEAKVKLLKTQVASTEELFHATGSVSKEELEEKQLEYDLAVAEYKQLQITEAREKMEYSIAMENLNRRRLRAPFAGVVIKSFLDEGENCEAREPLIRLVDPTRCRFITNIEEAFGRKMRKGQAVELEIRAGAGYVSLPGEIEFASPVVDPASGLLEIKAVFANTDGSIRPGVDGRIILNSNP